MIIKFKLIKKYPSLHKYIKEGNVFVRDTNCGTGSNYYFTSSCVRGILYSEVESNPEFFAPYLFTTEDGIDIYKGDTYCLKTTDNRIIKQCPVVNNYTYEDGAILQGQLTFSTCEAAQKWIEEQNRPKFEKGEWLYYDSGLSKMLFRFDKIVDNFYISPEAYQVMNSGYIYHHTSGIRLWSAHKSIIKATFSQIEEILSKVAEHKGFKQGVKFKSVMSGGTYSVSQYQEFKYHDYNNALLEGWGNCVYKDGVWAEIVENVPEYVECVEIPEKWITWDEIKKGRVFKTCEDAAWGDKYRLLLESGGGQTIDKHTERYFKPSTKEAYDAQFKTKELTITLDGDVVNTSHWGNNVKIVYK